MRAIDADAFEVVAYKGIPEGYNDTFGDGVDWILEKIDRMPTIEPEPIRCKDCKRHNIDIGDFREDGNTRHWFWKDEACPLVQYRGKAQGHEFDYQFCAYAERRSDE